MLRRAIRATARRGVCTLAGHMEVSGIGLHTGARVRVVARPAAASEGIYFVRTDLGGEPRIAASIASVTDTRLSKTLGDGDGALGRGSDRALSRVADPATGGW